MKSKNEAIDIINKLSVESFDNIEEFRTALLKISKITKQKLASTAETKFCKDVAESYILDLLNCTAAGKKFPTIPIEIAGKTRSRLSKGIISRLCLEHPEFRLTKQNQLVETARKFVISSENILELRKALKLYSEATDTVIDVEIIDALNNDNKIVEDQLEYYKTAYHELCNCLTADDMKTLEAMKVCRLSKEGFSERAIAEQLGVTRSKVRSILANYEFG